MNNSVYAFKMNVSTLVDNIPLRDKRTLYMVTFTAPEVITPKEFKRRWNNFLRMLKRTLPNVPWVRVFELHPSPEEDFQGHGLHIHALTNVRPDVNLVRKIALAANLGRIHSKPLPHGKATNYISKYLIKTKRSHAKILKGMRLWQTINFRKLKVKVKNIVRFTFKSWFLKNIKSHFDHFRILDNELAVLLSRKISLNWGYRKFKIMSEFFDENHYRLAQTLTPIYNKLRADYGLEPQYVF